MVRGMVPACQDDRPTSSKENHPKTNPDRLTKAYLPRPIYGLTPAMGGGSDHVLTSLSERERKILEMRFGLVDGFGHTLEEIGNLYSVTRERIRQIEAKALRKLRHPTRVHHLHGFLENHQELVSPGAPTFPA